MDADKSRRSLEMDAGKRSTDGMRMEAGGCRQGRQPPDGGVHKSTPLSPERAREREFLFIRHEAW